MSRGILPRYPVVPAELEDARLANNGCRRLSLSWMRYERILTVAYASFTGMCLDAICHVYTRNETTLAKKAIRIRLEPQDPSSVANVDHPHCHMHSAIIWYHAMIFIQYSLSRYSGSLASQQRSFNPCSQQPCSRPGNEAKKGAIMQCHVRVVRRAKVA